ncbi:hypothetical protein GCM10011579_071710 [Streptomyces albiflavescens]|uniref:Uncharacterized protein n=1 Tax=Streptomyces albiflavescens TaxID=1623582 RepID=A0A917YBE8_9ACTN|nr:hypothetical protein [Streptomyces albiflavescens]GGN83223.1 hypothetical protein GCM10011579_071710 [Streptomyces albiflavescens]
MTTRVASRNSSHPRAAYTDTPSAHAAPLVCKKDTIPAEIIKAQAAKLA